jgi:ribosomal protein L40E
MALPAVEQPEAERDLVTCRRCGFRNPQAARFCNNCGASLMRASVLFERLKREPASLSLIVTTLGLFFIPVLGAIPGIILAYRALYQTRRHNKGSERLARIAVVVGWASLVIGLLPLCLVATSSGLQAGYTFCNGLFDVLSNVIAGRNG